MDVLIIGGTRFTGRHLTEAALVAGHAVTLFHRGKTGSDLFPEAEHVLGDRDGDLGALDGRTFDAVVDMCGYVPRVVRTSARALAGRAGHYTFVSSISVYAGFRTGPTEGSPVGTLEDPTVEEITGETYGPLKALCEREVEQAFPGRALVVRSGLMVGPHDPTDRFTYWPRRVAAGGEVLAPAPPDQPVQLIDARDLAAWMLRSVEAGLAGTFNATGPAEELTFERLLSACREVAGSDARFTWVDPDAILEAGVEPWSELPLWLPGVDDAGLHRADVSRAVAAGLAFRPIEDTIRDTLAWEATLPPDRSVEAGLDPAKERAVLEAWGARGRR
ncbi:MAG: SDR family oxidoreductase [Actinobacteria bacterium]|nr:SDR family oxidoreductase [Actinomycetota bacterium]